MKQLNIRVDDELMRALRQAWVRSLSFQPVSAHYPFSQYLRDVLSREVRVTMPSPARSVPEKRAEVSQPGADVLVPAGLSRAQRRRLQRERRS
jgi:hypothetical protein